MKGGDRLQNLKELRKKAGMTQEQLAKKLGVGRSTVTRWEAEGERYPMGALLPKIAAALGCKEGDFF